MKKMTITAVCLTIISVSSYCMANTGNIENGEKLFKDATLGGSTNQKSCSTCHEENALAGAGSKTNLKEFINMCISRPLGGHPLKFDSQEMLDLEAYIKSLKKE